MRDAEIHGMGFSRVHHVTVWLMGWQSPCVEVSVYMYTGDYVSMFCVCMFMCVCVVCMCMLSLSGFGISYHCGKNTGFGQ